MTEQLTNASERTAHLGGTARAVIAAGPVYPPGTDVYGNGKRWVSVQRPAREEPAQTYSEKQAERFAAAGRRLAAALRREEPAGETNLEHALSIQDVPDEHGPRGVCSCGTWVDSDQDGSVPAIADRWGKHWLHVTGETKPEAQR
ncbi:MAG TPA: hypothetical protein VGL02_18365 [Streptomyces sp.]